MISQAPKSWISSPLGINILLSLCGVKGPVLDKFIQINSELRSSNVVRVNNKILASTSFDNVSMADNTQVQKLDLKNSDVDKAINSWVDKYGSFKHDISKHIQRAGTESVLLNISTVKTRWKSIQDGKGTTMKIYNSFNYTEDVKYEARLLELPFQEEDMKLVIIVPNEKDALSTLISTLTERGLEETINSIQPLFTVTSELAAPKIKFESEITTKLDNSQVAIQYGDVDVNENGVSVKVLTCLLPHTSENKSNYEEEKGPPSLFFAATFKGTAIFTGNFKPT